MELVFSELLTALFALWWPFVRTMAMLSVAPVIGDGMVPVTVRLLVSLVLAVVLLPVTRAAVPVDPFSMAGVVTTLQQVLIGGALGFAFHFTMSIVTVLGFTLSSQIGLSMAIMNDPMNGNSSDVVSTLLSVLCITIFFVIDGHLVLTGVLGASLQAWPVGAPLALDLHMLAMSAAWIFSAALLLAVPMVFSTMVVQIGFGFLNRVAPAFNLFSLGFSLVTMFGLFMLAQVVKFVPAHYMRMMEHVLGLLHQQMRGG